MCVNDITRRCLVECYWPGIDDAAFTLAVRRTHVAAAALSRSGRRIDVEDCILVPLDETVFCLFAGPEEDVRRVSREAGLPFERVLESVRIHSTSCGFDPRD
jgi:hypothetical protein